jgi:hypothetical protein
VSGRAGLNKFVEFPNRIYCETKTFDGMSGLKGGKVRYFQDRCTNAYGDAQNRKVQSDVEECLG